MSLKYFWNLKYDLNLLWTGRLQKAFRHKRPSISTWSCYYSACNVNKHSSNCLWIPKHKPIDKLIRWSLRRLGTKWRQFSSGRLLRNQAFHSNDDMDNKILLARKKKSNFYDPLKNAKKLPTWGLCFFGSSNR